MDQQLLEDITYICQLAKCEGRENVATWMQRMLAATIREERPRRKRGVRVQFAKIQRANAVLDAERVAELMSSQGGVVPRKRK